jgi:hypothetical protein
MLVYALGDDALGQTKSYDWFNRFKNCLTPADDDERFGKLHNAGKCCKSA